MSSDSSPTRLEHVLNFANGRSSPDRAEHARYPVYGSNGLIGRAGEKNSEPNTIVIGRVGSYCGSVHFSKDACWVTDNAIRATAKNDHDPVFLYYLLKHLNLNSWRSGSGQPLINQATLNSIEAPIPEPTEQRAISGVIGALDDRIALLRETNTTLEAIAQALFKSWFVDFDPVRAKMAGRAPEGMDEATAALFPDALEETELGVVPKGWLAAKLGATIEQFGGVIQTGPFGSQLHASDYVERGTPVAMPKDLDQRRISEASVARVADEHVQRLAKHQLKAGDILFSRRGDVERHALITPVEQGWLCGTGCLLVRPGAAWRWPTFLSMHLDTTAAKAWLVQHAVGATMPNLNTGILSSVPILLPSIELMDSFEGIVAEFEKKRSENFAMIGTLASLRDALLPRLISGQLRLS